MKFNLQRAIYMLSKYFLYSFFLQMVFINLAAAINVHAQYKSIDEVLITLDRTNLTLKQFFNRIESKSDFQFAYDKQDIDGDFLVVLEQKNATVEDYLKQIAVQASLSFRQVNNNIDIKKIHKPIDEQVMELDVTVRGKVTDESGAPIPGVTVSVPGSSIGTATDLEGNYSLVVDDNSTLVFSL